MHFCSCSMDSFFFSLKRIHIIRACYFNLVNNNKETIFFSTLLILKLIVGIISGISSRWFNYWSSVKHLIEKCVKESLKCNK